MGWSGSESMTQVHSHRGASKEPKNTYPEWIYGFLWCTMIRVILNDLSGSKSFQRNAPQCYGLMLSHLMELSDTGWITVQQSPISFQRHEKPGLQCTALFKTRIPRTTKNKQMLHSDTLTTPSSQQKPFHFVFPILTTCNFPIHRGYEKFSRCSVTKKTMRKGDGTNERTPTANQNKMLPCCQWLLKNTWIKPLKIVAWMAFPDSD